MRRKHQRRDPLKTMGEIDGAVTGIIERQWTDVLHFLLVLVVAIDEPFAV